MNIMKIRRVGNSNVVSLPHELEQRGYTPGKSVVIEELPSGELRIVPAPQMRHLLHEVSQRLITEDQQALQILAEHDRTYDEPPTSRELGS